MAQQPQQQERRTAVQRIDDTERGLSFLFQQNQNLNRDVTTLKEALKLVNDKLDATTQASREGKPLTDEVISKIMLDNNIIMLKGKVQALVDQGILVSADTIADGTFVVGQEVDKDGKVVNARLQFTLSSLPEETRNTLKGAKVGSEVSFKGAELKFSVQEVYSIVTPKAPEAPAQTAEASAPTDQPVATTPEASAPAQSSSDAAPATPEADQSNQSSGN